MVLIHSVSWWGGKNHGGDCCLKLGPRENGGARGSPDVERCAAGLDLLHPACIWLGCPVESFEFCCHSGFVFLGIIPASSRKIPLSPTPPSKPSCKASQLTFLCVFESMVLLLFSCLFFMMFQLIHHTPCALEWNSTHTNPWRLKKSSQGIFHLFYI